MEFQYRAGDERRRRSPSPPTVARSPAPSNPVPADGQPVAVADAEDMRRQAEKARIRARILHEETMERFELELEVRLELVERFHQSSVQNMGGAEPPAWVTAANFSSPVVPKDNSKVIAPVTSLAKRKSPVVHGAASNACVDMNSKKQKVGLTCPICGITANGEKDLQDHLNGKNHKKKAAALAAQPETVPEPDEEAEATQMDGYLLCEVCNVRTADRVTMMCHFNGTKHISKAMEMGQATGDPPAGSTPSKKRISKHTAPPAAVASTVIAAIDPNTVVLEVDGESHTVRRAGRSLLCEGCAVRAPSESGMRLHLSGKKHKNKANANFVASSSGAKPQVVDKATAAVGENTSQMKVPLVIAMQEKAADPISEEQDKMAKSANKDVVAVEISSEAPRKEAAKVSSVANTVSDSDLVMEVDGMRHPLRRVEGILLCPCCNVKSKSDIVMKSHLVGKKHKTKMTSTSMKAEANIPKTAKAGGGTDMGPPTTLKAKNAARAAVAPMQLDAPAELEVEAVITPTEPADDTTEPAGKPITIYVEGKMFSMLQQENGRLSCELCGVRGSNKDDMVKHMYTRTHWDKARLAEKEQLALAKDGNGDPAGSPATVHFASVFPPLPPSVLAAGLFFLTCHLFFSARPVFAPRSFHFPCLLRSPVVDLLLPVLLPSLASALRHLGRPVWLPESAGTESGGATSVWMTTRYAASGWLSHLSVHGDQAQLQALRDLKLHSTATWQQDVPHSSLQSIGQRDARRM
ncbi:hypothetical protein QOZ80_8BG0653090 [Eleusine coracana subsp. coracana]|nr:hypothetical protein QOZ80_8BG0653090 [Eleusine coracana subsp. coracana]